MTLNVSNTTPGQILGYTWNVTDPSGSTNSFFSGASANGPFLILTAVYPRDFSGASVKFNGTYRVNIFQSYPAVNPPPLVAMGKFYCGLTDSLSYQRTSQLSILAQGYAGNENITIRVSHAGVPTSGFPRSQLANGSGAFSYIWAIPASTPLGPTNVTLTGQTTTKKPADSQIFTVLPTTVSITQLAANTTLAPTSGNVVFSFSATYPDGSQVRTGTTTIRVVEPDGTTIHSVSASYNSTLNAFQATYRVAPTGPSGAWAAIIDSNSFDDGYANIGPTTSIVRGFIIVSASSQNSVTPVITDLLLTLVILLAAVLAIILAWVLFFGRKKVQRNVLKVDFQSIEREAARVESRDFFAKVHDQLKQRHPSQPEEETKDG